MRSDSNSTSAAAPRAGREVDVALHMAACVDDNMQAPTKLLAVVEWIETARQSLSMIDYGRRANLQLDQALRDRSIATCIPWDAEESQGLQLLMQIIARRLADAVEDAETTARGVQLEVRSAAPAPGTAAVANRSAVKS